MSCRAALACLLFFPALLAAEERSPSPARELLERVVAQYRELGTYRELLQVRELVVRAASDVEKPADRVQELSRHTCEIAVDRTGRLLARPGAEAPHASVVADGKELLVVTNDGSRHTRIPQRDDLWEQLSILPVNTVLHLSTPTFFVLHEDPLPALASIYGTLLPDVLEDAELGVLTVTFALPRGVLVEFAVEPETLQLHHVLVIEEIQLEGGRTAQRVVEIRSLFPRTNPLLAATLWDGEIPIGSREVPLSELDGQDAKPAGRLPEFTLPAVERGGEPLSEEVIGQGKPWLLVFHLTWDKLAPRQLEAISKAVQARGEKGVVRLAAIALDEDVDRAKLALRSLPTGFEGYLDPGARVAASIGIEDPLTTLVVDGQGNLKLTLHGVHDGDDVLDRILEALEEESR